MYGIFSPSFRIENYFFFAFASFALYLSTEEANYKAIANAVHSNKNRPSITDQTYGTEEVSL